MRKITFGKSTPLGDGESETVVYVDGDDLATIRKETANIATGASRDWYPRFAASSYEIEFYDEDAPEDKIFEVSAFGSARQTLAAAKAYAREVLA